MLVEELAERGAVAGLGLRRRASRSTASASARRFCTASRSSATRASSAASATGRSDRRSPTGRLFSAPASTGHAPAARERDRAQAATQVTMDRTRRRAGGLTSRRPAGVKRRRHEARLAARRVAGSRSRSLVSCSATRRSGGRLDPLHAKRRSPNGMTVILHEDHDVPIVVVNVSYGVGSRFEAPGRTGFAHLFEHLMFMGTRARPDEGVRRVDGGAPAAGTTRGPATTAPTTTTSARRSSLDLLLWLEADRLRDLGPLMTLEKLDAQREVVRNERRQTSENTPYGKVELRLPELLYPEGHPYHHPVIGSHEDLEAATVDDVKGFFATHYDPTNASLVVAGDFDPAKAKAAIERWFGTIPSRGDAAGSRRARLQRHDDDAHERRARDDRGQRRARRRSSWRGSRRSTSARATPSSISLATALATGKASRLYKALVYDQKIAQSVEASAGVGRRSARASPSASSRGPASRSTKLEAAIDKELARVRKTPLADDELTRAKNLVETGVRHAPPERARARLAPQHVRGRGEGSGLRAEGPRALPRRDEGRHRDVAAKYLAPERARHPPRRPEGEEGGASEAHDASSRLASCSSSLARVRAAARTPRARRAASAGRARSPSGCRRAPADPLGARPALGEPGAVHAAGARSSTSARTA